jgi:hypothetical protein
VTTYNGHKNWNHWNVALWINNHPGLYSQAWACAKTCPNLDHAAKELIEFLPQKTPDGALYSFTAVRAALRGII